MERFERFTPELVDRAVALWDAGLSYEAIAAVMRLDFDIDINGRNVRTRLVGRRNRLGLPPASRHRYGMSHGRDNDARRLRRLARNG